MNAMTINAAAGPTLSVSQAPTPAQVTSRAPAPTPAPGPTPAQASDTPAGDSVPTSGAAARDPEADQAAASYTQQLLLAQVAVGSPSVSRPSDVTPGRLDGLDSYLREQLDLRADRHPAHVDLRG